MNTFLLLTQRIDNIPGKITERVLINSAHIQWVMPEGEGTRVGLLNGAILPIMEDFQYMRAYFGYAPRPVRKRAPKKSIVKSKNIRKAKQKGKKK